MRGLSYQWEFDGRDDEGVSRKCRDAIKYMMVRGLRASRAQGRVLAWCEELIMRRPICRVGVQEAGGDEPEDSLN